MTQRIFRSDDFPPEEQRAGAGPGSFPTAPAAGLYGDGRKRLVPTRLQPSIAVPDASSEAVMTRYREAFKWTDSIDAFVRWHVREKPLLNVCSGHTPWGDVSLDLHEPADVKGSWDALPFERDTFGAVFADPPWDSGHKSEVSDYMREALRVAPVAYLMAPWLYCAAWSPISKVWWREFPGVHTPILLSRYERSRQLSLEVLSATASAE